MNKLYHITKEENLDSILTEGLIPLKVKGLTVSSHRDHPDWNYVFLTNSVEYIIKTQVNSFYVEQFKPIIFEIDIEGLDVSPVKYKGGGTYSLSNFEFITNKIEVERIKYIGYYTDFINNNLD